MGTEKEKFAQMVKALEQPETYFGLVSTISASEQVTYKEAWERVEKEREGLGLPPKYCNIQSFHTARYKFHQSGQMIRIIDYPIEGE
jgi:hypothetical protein